ncbi:hypothetical protein [Rufibacter sp. LB8]|uniref:hypothetical protein n=1 Tax=Rufibacter sp. LB8 TaxID=2777781 RepID=UPI00178C5B87|nr:hypothetical protein [Rufibacter sp. LB8]
MNTRILMSGSAVFMGALGLYFSFFPDSFTAWLCGEAQQEMALAMQLLGALYLAFGVLNWMARRLLLGGVYARPLSMANFLHFLMGALALGKGVWAAAEPPVYLMVLAAAYGVFAVLFGLVLFARPAKVT